MTIKTQAYLQGYLHEKTAEGFDRDRDEFIKLQNASGTTLPWKYPANAPLSDDTGFRAVLEEMEAARRARNAGKTDQQIEDEDFKGEMDYFIKYEGPSNPAELQRKEKWRRQIREGRKKTMQQQREQQQREQPHDRNRSLRRRIGTTRPRSWKKQLNIKKRLT